ncbi:MAG TPA: carbohydrate binding domain-containing protein [Cellvibrionaceae bacterium]|nr:carbohydrate binding domain-containing protein [Cellvibrionaceae bacterium]
MTQIQPKPRLHAPWILALSISALTALSAQAGIVAPKPAPHGSQNPEMGRMLARVGTYTLAGAELETVLIPNETTQYEPSQFQGSAYLYNGSNITPERIYRFPGKAHTMEYAGWSVALSNQWAAFATRPYVSSAPGVQNDPTQTYVYIVGKTNGVWNSCPTENSLANNCNNAFRNNGVALTKPLTRIAFGTKSSLPENLDANSFAMAISDKYLVLANSRNSIVNIYRYNSTSKNWDLEFNLDDDDYKTVGRAVAISGDKVAITSSWMPENQSTPGVFNGYVRIYHRNATTGTWSMTSQADGLIAGGNYGYRVKMEGNNLVVAAGTEEAHRLYFYRFDSNDRINGSPFVVPFSGRIRGLSLSGETVAVAGGDNNYALSVFSRNTLNSAPEWKRSTSLAGSFYSNRNFDGQPYQGIDEVEVVGDDLSLGWRAHNSTTQPNNFKGAVIFEKVSLLDSCREPTNLVANCSFDAVTNNSLNTAASGANWSLLSYLGASGSVDYTGRQMRVSINNPGSDMWHVQARTAVNLSQAVNYVLTFRAKADNNRGFVVNIGHNGNQDNNWQSYGRVNVSATTEWTEYSYEFSGVPMDANAFLDFNFGNAGTSAVTIDSVKLKALN